MLPAAALGANEPNALSTQATEFLPTLSMACPLVGILEEGDAARSVTDHRANKRFWGKSRPKPLDVRPAASAQGIPSTELSATQLQRRIRNLEIGKETKDYQFLSALKGHQAAGGEPLTPEPRDATISKRGWDRVVKEWRAEVRRHYLAETEGIFSGSHLDTESISTEAEETATESISTGSEADDSSIVNSDDSASAHWSSR